MVDRVLEIVQEQVVVVVVVVVVLVVAVVLAVAVVVDLPAASDCNENKPVAVEDVAVPGKKSNPVVASEETVACLDQIWLQIAVVVAVAVDLVYKRFGCKNFDLQKQDFLVTGTEIDAVEVVVVA